MTSVKKANIKKISDNEIITQEDLLAIEEPLEIRISFLKDESRQEKNISVTMRTPGNDEELALGFLYTEGIIKSYDQVYSHHSISENVIVLSLNDDVVFDSSKLERHFYTTSSCGVCGKSSIDAIHVLQDSVKNNSEIIFNSKDIQQLPEILREKQNIFEQTGGLHASALFDNNNQMILLKEDVGRHNALDKLIGAALKSKLFPLNNFLLLLSGRASFELIQKATMAGINIVAAVGAPSSLAVELAYDRDMTLIGFLKKDKFNIYCGIKRIKQ